MDQMFRNYVATNHNPGNSASCGISVNKLMRSRTWLTRPVFLCNSEDCWPASPTHRLMQTLFWT